MKVKQGNKENALRFKLSRKITAALKGLALEHDVHLDILLRSISAVFYLKLSGISKNPYERYEDWPFLRFVQRAGENLTEAGAGDWTVSWEVQSQMLEARFITSVQPYNQDILLQYDGYLQKLIGEILETPQQKIADFEILSEEERRRVLYDFNCTSLPYPWNKVVCSVFEEQVEKRPNNTAVIKVFCHVPFDQEYLTYSELNKKANRLARLLRNLGVQGGTPIGLMIERSLEMAASLWAILKAGGTYLPIDPEYPEQKILSMLEQADTTFLLTQTAILKEKSFETLSSRKEFILVDRLEKQARHVSLDNFECSCGAGDLIYINFTFAATGKPYGAGIYHHNFMNLMCWFLREFKLTAEDRNLLMTPLNLDISQKNLYAPLMTGGALCLPAFNYFEPVALLREIRENWVTWINCTPAMFYQLAACELAEGKKKLAFLRYVFLGDELVLLSPLVDWLESDGCQVQLVNTYGPGECADVCAFYRLQNPGLSTEEPVPIGKPVNNVELYVLDKNLKPVPIGVPGELYIGGEGVGGGYINDKESTIKKFIMHTFEEGKPPDLLYRTGDMVKWLPDGNLEFLGRIEP
jgi:amino acid adenylation domain-containing protein